MTVFIIRIFITDWVLVYLLPGPRIQSLRGPHYHPQPTLHKGTCFIYCCLITLLPNFKNGTGLLCMEVSRGWWGHPDTVQQLPLWSTDKQLHSAPAWMVQVLGRDLALVPTLVSSKTLCRMTGEKEIRAHTLLQFRFIFLIKTPWILNLCLIKNEGHWTGNTTKHNFWHRFFSALSCCRSPVALIKRWEETEVGSINSWRNQSFN